jgi:hypothetical protein
MVIKAALDPGHKDPTDSCMPNAAAAMMVMDAMASLGAKPQFNEARPQVSHGLPEGAEPGFISEPRAMR